MRLAIGSERHGRAHVVQPVGELDLTTAPQFEHELKRVEATDAEEIVVDLSRLQSIDYVGLNILVRAAARSSRRGGGLKLVRGPDPVHRRFQSTGLESHLPFAD
ncbi:MAG: anti-sigma factor antagonist [Solirubrobacteraceae bacterium]|jgi:anti-sigma B factor antagonist|nr:anti-sigma factor antagonist [Solirubrobacteraceae bacterium]